jgi:hypothetical protein
MSPFWPGCGSNTGHNMGAFTTQGFHAHGGLEVAKPSFDLPPPRIEAGQFFGGMSELHENVPKITR